MINPIELFRSIKMDFTICGQRCHLVLTVHDTISLDTGDSIESTTIDEIIGEDGQVIHPKTLTVSEFRTIIRNVRYNPAIT